MNFTKLYNLQELKIRADNINHTNICQNLCLSSNGLKVLEIINQNNMALIYSPDDLIFEKYFNKNKIKLFKTNVYTIKKQIQQI